MPGTVHFFNIESGSMLYLGTDTCRELVVVVVKSGAEMNSFVGANIDDNRRVVLSPKLVRGGAIGVFV
jgi:hypothetical protein